MAATANVTDIMAVYVEGKEKDEKTFGKYVICVECEDVPAVVECAECQDVFCGLCFEWLHKKGNRSKHRKIEIQTVPDELRSENKQNMRVSVEKGKEEEIEIDLEPQMPDPLAEGAGEGEGTTKHFVKMFEEAQKDVRDDVDEDFTTADYSYEKELKRLHVRCQAIPLRLTEEERTLLHILEGALDVSEYTDNVDVSSNMFGWRSMFDNNNNKEGRMKKELLEFFAFVHGLYVCSSLRNGKKLIDGRKFRDNASFLAKVFEIGRRYKIMNPDKMRSTYGKLMYILMDTAAHDLVDYDVIVDIRTVDGEFRKVSGIYSDPLLIEATKNTNSAEEVAGKMRARSALVEKYVCGDVDKEMMVRCLDSISDANNYILFNRDPVEKMITYLKTHFDSKHAGHQETDLEIRYGMGGSKLSHGHGTQYVYVLQSLTLWSEIQNEMYWLWINADADLLSRKGYNLCNTGQGLQRVQGAPNVSRCMSTILGRVQHRMGGWVGLSVVHLGDRDVPNALIFIDKYTQVPRILGPFVNTIEQLRVIAKENEDIHQWINKVYGGTERAILMILRDFFRHGFDGSGDDGGSCVDGRLTSAWNWCSKLEKKSFCHLFMLTGFEGFNGSFRK